MRDDRRAPRLLVIPAVLGLVFVLAPPVHAADWYAAVGGNPTAAGTLADPWNLQRALNNQSPIAPGDTIWVRGGVYLGPFTSYLKGTAAAPITVRSYGRERVIINWQYYECNPLHCPPAEWQAQNPWYPACPAGNGEIRNWQCNSFTFGCDPDANPACSNYVNSVYNGRGGGLNFSLASHHAIFWGLELMSAENGGRISPLPAGCSAANPTPGCCWNSSTGQLYPECDSSNPLIARNLGGNTRLVGDDITMINCIFHDGVNGVDWFTESENSEIYGSVVFNNGYVDGLRGHGHGTYNQNVDCTDRPSRKTWKDTVFFNNFGLGMQVYSAGCGPVNDIVADGVVSFDNKMPTKAFYAQKALTEPEIYGTDRQYEFTEAMYLGSQRGARGLQIRNSYTFGRLDEYRDSHSGVRIDSGGSSTADAWIENSVFVGNLGPVMIYNTGLLRFTGNRIAGGTDSALLPGYKFTPLSLIEPQRGSTHWSRFQIEDNDYWWNNGPAELRLQGPAGNQWVSFAAWQSTYGFDATGSMTAGLPTTNWVYVRPNAYEPGRGHVVIYNWENLPAVTVDLTGLGLAEGQAYKVHNIQRFHANLDVNDLDYFGDVVASGTFHAATPTASVSMAYADATPPIGFPYSVPSSLPLFGAYLVLGQ